MQYTLPQNLPTIERQITESMIVDYSKVSNDFNPIHLDSTFANKAGFDTTIAHGMMVLSYLSEMMSVAFDTKWATTGQLKVKFRSPVLSGESIETFGELSRTTKDNNLNKAFYKVGINNKNGNQVITGEATICY
jgi:3-hydroxybutyryl-CoA dehydratase